MIQKIKNCLYCKEKMESITAKKRFCSGRCRVYYFRSKSTLEKVTSHQSCVYCGEKMESITAKKRYCSSKCKVYHWRERKCIVTEPAQNDRKTEIVGNLPGSEKERLKSPKIEKLPPSNLRGLDLAIWKAENGL